jgi:preprotein translocase subunit SecG
MYLVISVFIIIVCVLLTLIVLVQNSKGGGLASNFASSNQVMGVRKTADFLEKATWTLAVSLLVLSLLAAFALPRENSEGPRSAIQEKIDNTKDESQTPAFPVGQEQQETEEPVVPK